jgi:hypothetical protein
MEEFYLEVKQNQGNKRLIRRIGERPQELSEIDKENIKIILNLND